MTGETVCDVHVVVRLTVLDLDRKSDATVSKACAEVPDLLPNGTTCNGAVVFGAPAVVVPFAELELVGLDDVVGVDGDDSSACAEALDEM